MTFLRRIFAAFTVLCLALLGPSVALDLGGVLDWTHYVGALAIILISISALLVAATENRRIAIGVFAICWPLLCWIAYSWFQCLPLAPDAVAFASPGAYDAYFLWMSPLLPVDQVPSSIPISVGPDLTRHAASVLLVLLPLAFSTTLLTLEKSRIVLLLQAIAISVSGHAIIGMLFSEVPVWGTMGQIETISSTHFGTFINRNNAALLLNLGLACSIGLVCFRLAALAPVKQQGRRFQFAEIQLLLGDRDALIGILSTTICVVGLLGSGSRGGIVGAVFGSFVVAGWLRSKRGILAIPAIGGVLVVVSALAFMPLAQSFRTIERFGVLDPKSGNANEFGRLKHWPDGARAAVKYFPGGSGLATYAYAYLPYQQTSPEFWCDHADNLWLELVTEQGVAGIVLAIWLLLIIVIALTRLAQSTEPIDHGVKMAGWFAIVTTVVTQVFDFGLILTGNLFTFTVIASTVVTRGFNVPRARKTEPSNNSLNASTTKLSSPLGGTRFRGLAWILPSGALAVALGMLGLPTLKADAINDSLTRSLEEQLSLSSPSPDLVDSFVARLDGLDETQRTADVELANIRIKTFRGRIATVDELDPADGSDLLAAFDAAHRREQRKRWYELPGANASRKRVIASSYLDAAQSCRNALSRSPLAIRPRMHFVLLDFAHEDSERSRLAIEQLETLQSRSPKQLAKLAVLAGDSLYFELSAALWRQATDLNVYQTESAIRFASKYESIAIQDFISEGVPQQRVAARYLLDYGNKFDSLRSRIEPFLANVLANVSCETCESKRDEAVCEELRGDIEHRLGNVDKALSHYGRAHDLTPANRRLILKFSKRLAASGRQEDALAMRKLLESN